MSIEIGIGFSNNMDPEKAAAEAAKEARGQIDRDRIDFALVFNSDHYPPETFLPVIYETLERTKMIGTSCAGLIVKDRPQMRGLLVVAFYSDHLRFETGYQNHSTARNAYQEGVTLSKSCMSDFGKEHRKAFLLFSDGLFPYASSVVEGIQNNFDNKLFIFGAKGGDDFGFQKTYQYFHNTVLTNGSVGLLLGGQINIGAGCRTGFAPLGKPRLVTETKDHIISAIDGHPACRLYEDFFEDEARSLLEDRLCHIKLRYPLGFKDGKRALPLIRNIHKTLDDGSLVCHDMIPKNSELHIMIGSASSCLQSAMEAAHDVKARLKGSTPRLIIVMESQTRYQLMGRSAGKEILAVKNILGPEIPLVGMYSSGEFFSSGGKGDIETQLQNGSILILGIT